MYAFMVARTISTSILRHYIHIVAIQYVYPLGYCRHTVDIQSLYCRNTVAIQYLYHISWDTAAIQSQYSTCILWDTVAIQYVYPLGYSRNTVRVSSGIQSQYSTCIL